MYVQLPSQRAPRRQSTRFSAVAKKTLAGCAAMAVMAMLFSVGYYGAATVLSSNITTSAISRMAPSHAFVFSKTKPSMDRCVSVGSEPGRRNPIQPPRFQEEMSPETSKLDFLEAKPYWDQSTLPLNTFKNKAPLTAHVVSVNRLVGPNAPGEVCEIVLDHGGQLKYWEGQSAGVIPPGIDEKKGKPHKTRLYSIASTRYGDKLDGRTMTFTVRRATYYDPDLGREDPEKKGICSNFLCDAKPGTPVTVTGPSGKVMLLPEKTPEAPLIMIATGTGIAPFRGFLKRLFMENTEAAAKFAGQAWLFLGVANSDALLYDDWWQELKAKHPDQFRYDVALSREQKNKNGGKMYIQDRVEEYGEELFAMMNEKGAHMYFCGLKGMMPGVLETLERVAEKQGLNWEETLKKWKENKQWHVEVY